jgi:predicted transcriptional regulator
MKTKSFELLTVDAIMSPSPESLSYDQSIGEATRFLLEERIHGAPVVGRDGVVIGVLSTTDILAAISSKLFDDRSCEVEEIRQMRQTGIGMIVTSGAVTCSPSTTVAEACALMNAEKVHRLIVTDNGVPIGILSPSDIVSTVATR